MTICNHGDGEAETGGSWRLAGHSGWPKSWAPGSWREPEEDTEVNLWLLHAQVSSHTHVRVRANTHKHLGENYNITFKKHDKHKI